MLNPKILLNLFSKNNKINERYYTCKTSYKNELKKGINFYNKHSMSNTFTHFSSLLQNKDIEKDMRATCHLYLAKALMHGSSVSERLALEHIKKSNKLFSSGPIKPDFINYQNELINLIEEIKLTKGSLLTYEKKLDKFMIHFNILIDYDQYFNT